MLGPRLAAFVTTAVSLGTLVACAADSAREVVVVAHGMTFVLADQPQVAMPVIQFKAGERVRLVLKNEAPGLLHDFRIPAWGVQLPQLRAGETADVTFTVPTRPGQYEYVCRPHAELMKGVVEVTP